MGNKHVVRMEDVEYYYGLDTNEFDAETLIRDLQHHLDLARSKGYERAKLCFSYGYEDIEFSFSYERDETEAEAAVRETKQRLQAMKQRCVVKTSVLAALRRAAPDLSLEEVMAALTEGKGVKA
jgi:hypothetical protein